MQIITVRMEKGKIMTAFFDVQAKRKCYALIWSYGEICVGCGCCSKDPLARAKARLEYHTKNLKDSENFSYWDDEPKIRAIQEKNVATDIRYYKRRVAYYTKRVAELERGERKENENET